MKKKYPAMIKITINIPAQMISSEWKAQKDAMAVPARSGPSNGKQHNPQPTIAVTMIPILDFLDCMVGPHGKIVFIV